MAGPEARSQRVLPFGITLGIIIGSMKTAISIDDGLLQEADEAAHLMGLSRSRLFALAVGDFLQQRRQQNILRQLNEVYAGGLKPTEKRLLNRIKGKARRTVRDVW